MCIPNLTLYLEVMNMNQIIVTTYSITISDMHGFFNAKVSYLHISSVKYLQKYSLREVSNLSVFFDQKIAVSAGTFNPVVCIKITRSCSSVHMGAFHQVFIR